MTSQCDVINKSTVSAVQCAVVLVQALVFYCHSVLTKKNSPGTY